MLVLTRKVNESIVIGDVTITVLAISTTRVRLGIDAPYDVAVYRKELDTMHDDDQGNNHGSTRD